MVAKVGLAMVVASSILAGGVSLTFGEWWIATLIAVVGATTAAVVTMDEYDDDDEA